LSGQGQANFFAKSFKSICLIGARDSYKHKA
jgi:hypothetical protein